MAESPSLGEEYTIRYPLVAPAFISVIIGQDSMESMWITPVTCIRAHTLLEQQPLTPQTASSLVELVYDYHTHGDINSELRRLQGLSEESVRNDIRDCAESGSVGLLGVKIKAAEQLLPGFKLSSLELARLFKEAYTTAAYPLSPAPNELSKDSDDRAEWDENEDTVTLQMKTCAKLLGAAEEALVRADTSH